MTCRRKRYDLDAAAAKVASIVTADDRVGLTTEARVPWCDECGAWHVETSAKWKAAS